MPKQCKHNCNMTLAVELRRAETEVLYRTGENKINALLWFFDVQQELAKRGLVEQVKAVAIVGV